MPRCTRVVLFFSVLTIAATASAQTPTYHLSKKEFGTSNVDQLKPVDPDAARLALLSVRLGSVAAGEHWVQAFVSRCGDPTDLGTIARCRSLQVKSRSISILIK